MTDYRKLEAMIQILFEDYVFWRGQTNNIKTKTFLRPMKMDDEKRTQLIAYIHFCGEHQLESRHFMYALFKARNFLFSVPMKDLCSARVLERYRTGQFGIKPGIYEKRIRDRPFTYVGERALDNSYDPRVDISAEVEARKEQLARLSTPERCITSIDDDVYPTRGYHPKSKTCTACPVQMKCQDVLRRGVKYDIVAVREGRLSLLDAERIAANR